MAKAAASYYQDLFRYKSGRVCAQLGWHNNCVSERYSTILVPFPMRCYMFTNLFAKHNVVRRTGLLISTLLIVTLSSRAQQVRVSDLLHYLQTPVSEFETCMLRQGFVCYRSTGNLWGWTCLFAYQPTHLLTQPEQASAIIQYDRNNRSDIILYQLRSPQQYLALQKELATLGFRMESALGDYCIFSQGNTIVTCREVDKSNGISGNYGGYSISMVRRHY